MKLRNKRTKMKLRNKKTGEIFDGGFILIPNSVGIIGNPAKPLAELNEEWEDYEPKEPLIKDEKIRKAVRAWAELNSIRKVVYVENQNMESCCFTSIAGGVDCYIKFVEYIPTLKDCEIYSIAELCGGEEK